MRKRAALLCGSLVTSVALLSGCVFQGEQSLEEMDKPKQENVEGEAAATEESVNVGQTDNTDVIKVETVARQLYLLDENGMVVPQTVPLPKPETNDVAKQVLQYLVKGGPVTDFLPSGFQAVLPAGTEVNGLDLLDDGTLVVDVSKDFIEYRPEDEIKILESMTYTLTQFENVDRIKLQINGYDTDVMPVNNTPLSSGYSRANGINLETGDVADISNSRSVTVYYPAQHDDQFYYVPVTKRVEGSSESDYATIIETLVNGPGYKGDLLNVFNDGVQLTEEPTVEDGVLSLTFNENVLSNFEDQSIISKKVMDSLVLSLTERDDVEAVSVKVKDFEEIYDEEGNAFTKPVTRPEMVNTGRF